MTTMAKMGSEIAKYLRPKVFHRVNILLNRAIALWNHLQIILLKKISFVKYFQRNI